MYPFFIAHFSWSFLIMGLSCFLFFFFIIFSSTASVDILSQPWPLIFDDLLLKVLVLVMLRVLSYFIKGVAYRQLFSFLDIL